MSVPVCISNKIVVDLPEKFTESINTPEGIKLFVDTTFRPEWHATVQADVVSVPQKLTIGGLADSIDPERPLIPQIVRPGDKIIFNYMVVMDRSESDNVADLFTEDERYINGNPMVKTWSNKKGQQIVRCYEMNNKWSVGLFDTQYKQFSERLDGVSELDVENFMGKFPFQADRYLDYNNILTLDGKDYFLVDYSQVIGIKRAVNGRERIESNRNYSVLEVELEREVEVEDRSGPHTPFFEMVGANLLLAPIHKPAGPRPQGLIEVYNMGQDDDHVAWGRVVAMNSGFGGKKLSLKPGDIAYCDSRYIEQYSIDGHDYWVVKQNRILGKK